MGRFGRGKAIGAYLAGLDIVQKLIHAFNLFRSHIFSMHMFFISMIFKINLAKFYHFDIFRIMKMTDTPTLTLETAASKFAALGSEQRLQVLHVLVRAGPSGLSMGDLGERSGITGSTLTHHLKILAAAGLATQTKHGRSMICAGADIAEVQALSEYLLRHCCADETCEPKENNDG